MNNTAPIWMGVAAVGALFGVIATVASYVVFDFSAIAAIFIGVVVGGLGAVVLWFGWRDPAPVAKAGAVGQAEANPVAEPTPPAMPAPAVTPEPAPEPVSAPEATPEPEPQVMTQAAAEPMAADGKPDMLDKPRGGAGDDLKMIKGVGPKLEALLNSMGVWHFDQVASWREKEVAWVDANLEGFKGRVSRDGWVDQAKVLAAGGTTEFSGKVKKGGVY